MGISLKEVSYSYNPKRKGTKYALKNVSLEINERDEMIAIIGESGSGKSTLVSLFNALKIPTLGEANVMGITIKKIRKRKENYNSIRKHVGLVFQFSDYQLFEETVLNDVMFAPMNFGYKKEEAKEIAIKALNLVGIDESFYDKSPFQLSGGEKKIVSIAGILAMEPDILVFDEPTAGLDPETKKKMIELFRVLNRDLHKTVVFITHDMNIVMEYAKRVIVVADRTIKYDGTKEELFLNHLDIVKDAHIDYPDTFIISKMINEKLNKNINQLLESKEELLEELLKDE